MGFRVISLRTPTAKLIFLTLLLIGLAAGLNPRVLHAHSATVPDIPVYRVKTSQKVMALTINVVWGTTYVPQLAQILEKAGVPATFMLGGAWAQAHPDLVRQLAQHGNQLGNHGWNHAHPTQLGYDALVADIRRTNETIQSITGVTPTVYAPPYGEFNRTVLRAAQSLHMTLTMWTIDTIDWRPSSSVDYMVNKISRLKAPGAIVLMHPTDRTVAALPLIIEVLKADGYRLVTVSRLLESGTPATDAQ